MTQKITVVNHIDGLMHVHDANCRDLNANRYLISNGLWTYEADSKWEIALDSYADLIDEGSQTEDQAYADHRFFPCVTLPEGTAA